MPGGTKIATCCYCGTRAALVLSGQTRHELACGSCGAPLRDMKQFPGAEASHGRASAPPAAHRPRHRSDGGPPTPMRAPEPIHKKRRKKRKSLGRRFLEEAFDAIEDIFD